MDLKDRVAMRKTIWRLNLRYWRPSQHDELMAAIQDAGFTIGYDRGFRGATATAEDARRYLDD